MGRTKTIDDETLVEVARRVFREKGHTAATRDVADAAGISQAILFQRFGSKEELFLRAMTPPAPDMDTLLGPYPPRNARTDLTRIVGRLAEFLSALMPTLMHVAAHPSLGARGLKAWHDRLPFGAIITGLTGRMERLAADGLVAKGNADATAHALLSLAHTVAMVNLLTGEGHSALSGRHLETVVDVLWQGIAPRAR